MKKTTSNLPLFAAFLILLSTFSLAGCYLLRPTGPCFGVGCPAHTVGQNGQYKKGEGPKSQPPANAQNKDSQPATAQSDPQPAQPAQPAPKEGNFFTNAWAKITRSR
jgi:hypothetical protein